MTSTNNDNDIMSHHQTITEQQRTTTTQTTRQIPWLCQYWCYISNDWIPKYVPFHFKIYNNIDITLTILSAIVLGMIRYLAEYAILVSIFHWPTNRYITKNAAGSVAAIFHSVQLVPSLYVCFRSSSTRYNPSQHMDHILDDWWHDTVNALLQFCTGYMIYDTVLNIIYMKLNMIGHISIEDYIFLAHHVATIVYMTSTRLIRQGHQSAMICMLLGEMTNPFHNMYYIAIAAQTLDCCNGTVSTFLFHIIELLFALSYVFVRTVVGPFVFISLTYNLWISGRRDTGSEKSLASSSSSSHRIPIPLLFLWTILIWGVAFGSIPWIQECYSMIQKYIHDPTLLLLVWVPTPISTTTTIEQSKLEL